MDAARMTAPRTAETASRVRTYFGEAGPFSYSKVKAIAASLLSGELSYRVATAGIKAIKFDIARKCNLDVAALVASRKEFRGRTFYKIKRVSYTIDKDFAVGIRPEAVAVVDGVPNLIFLQARKNPVPWALDISFMNRVLAEVYEDYFDEARFWLIDTEANSDGERQCTLVELSAADAMNDREFRRRIASLRQAWRLHLTQPAVRRAPKPAQPDNRQGEFGLNDPIGRT